MKKFIVIATVAVVAILVVWFIRGRTGQASEGLYKFVEVTRGDLENVISTTGTLSAVGTIEVGTQVSGTMARVLSDNNESVRKGQVLAVLDTTLLSASVRDARANVLRAEAQYEKALRDHGRIEDMHGRGLISDAEFDDSRTNTRSYEATLLSARASLDRGRANLNYAVIRSPIDGTVIMRSVEPGQTVAASFSTPTLFLIAEDLSDMEIHAFVDESDIGQIELGQSVRFTVEAHYEVDFLGTVREIWLQPETIQNVVNYTVVVDAANPDGLLFPGMTATTDFLIEERTDVLLVPNAAIRFQPSMPMMMEFRKTMEERVAAMPDSERQKMKTRMKGGGGGSGASGGGSSGGGGHGGFGGFGGELPDNAARLWYLDENGRVSVSRITTGATDGRSTEIVKGRDVEEGMQMISGVTEKEEEEQGSKNPLSNSMRRGRR